MGAGQIFIFTLLIPEGSDLLFTHVNNFTHLDEEYFMKPLHSTFDVKMCRSQRLELATKSEQTLWHLQIFCSTELLIIKCSHKQQVSAQHLPATPSL